MPITPDQSDALIAAVRAVAAEAILPRFRNLPDGGIDAKRAFDDLVTVADREAEAALTARVADLLPGAAVLGEEAVAADRSVLGCIDADRCVVIDPIDGTWNFAHGIANFGVIVAVVEAGATVWGLLYDPSFDDWIVAHRGGGASFVRGGTARPLRLPQEALPLDRMRGNLNGDLYPQADRPAIAALAPRFRRTSSLGASLHEYRSLATGATQFCLNGMLNVWDHAAGVLILEEAGGRSALLDGTDYAPAMREGRLLNAANPATWDALAKVVNEALAG
ncbi:inositol monophosphatase [Jannaschia sp. Os4]|uniref:inositol monophosphatase family protein n=1 Tax=Jannaschia sp. Os4 TaxID=2807617 RepID=UPI00193AB6F9|nr:inositol monophosphatase [Jannaschia sp. Os4]MBM2575031.1 inositol monophosphatase [Jannaschia sp. Os4]